jgi:hypothetical protein
MFRSKKHHVLSFHINLKSSSLGQKSSSLGLKSSKISNKKPLFFPGNPMYNIEHNNQNVHEFFHKHVFH